MVPLRSFALPLALCLAACDQKRAVGTIVQEFAGADVGRRQQLILELRAHGAAAVGGWIELLGQKDYDLYVIASGELGALGEQAAPAVPALVTFLRDGFPGMQPAEMSVLDRVRTEDAGRKPSRTALRSIGAPAIEALTGLLEHGVARARQDAVFALGGMGAVAKPAVPAVIRRLKDEDKAVATAAAWSLREIGHVDDAVKKALVAALGDPEPLVRLEAVKAIGSFGEEAEELRERVRMMAGDPDPRVRDEATLALRSLPVLPGKSPAESGTVPGPARGK